MKGNSAEIEFKEANWESVGLRLLAFARYWARAHYGWYDGMPMPGGYTPEDIVCEVYTAFQNGLTHRDVPDQSVRHFNGKDGMWIQLKRAVKSVLWNIHKLKKFSAIAVEDPDFFDPISDDQPSPEEALRTSEFCEDLFDAICSDLRVKKNEDLLKTVKAFENGATTVDEIVEDTGLSVARVYEMRRVLKAVAETALNKINKDGVGYERISKSSTKTA